MQFLLNAPKLFVCSAVRMSVWEFEILFGVRNSKDVFLQIETVNGNDFVVVMNADRCRKLKIV